MPPLIFLTRSRKTWSYITTVITTIILIASFDLYYSNVLLSPGRIHRIKIRYWPVSQQQQQNVTFGPGPGHCQNVTKPDQFSTTATTTTVRARNSPNQTFNIRRVKNHLVSRVNHVQNKTLNTNNAVRKNQGSSDDKLLINTLGCALPKTKFYPAGFVMKKDTGPNCDFEKKIVAIDDTDETLKLTAEGENSINENDTVCTGFEIHRNPKKDTFQNGAAFNVTAKDLLDISTKEAFAVKCGKYINFDAHFPITKKVRAKMNFWKNNQSSKPKPTPISVLFLGFDSVSRSHYHRSFPKTLPLMTKMGFVDFKGYHSIAPNTLSNFYAFLMGLENSHVRKHCAPKWAAPFDDCPAIWKDYGRNNFVTMYTEDGKQSFNWGGQGGFFKRPTDYYTHHLFASVQDYREKNTNPTNNKGDSCPSSMNNQNYLLDYTKRFLQKFGNKTPFFALTWCAYPFHDNTYSLYGIDDQVAQFFEFLNSDESRELRKRTLIILNSDHGERAGDFIHKGYKEGSIERLLPGLFVRLPENLLKQYPELNLMETLRTNSERLTSGFDLHHTFLHLLQITNLQILEENRNRSKTADGEFQPVLQDRSSLILPVSDQRTCADINISKENCMCIKTISNSPKSSNIKESTSALQFHYNNALFFNAMVKFAISELNSVIQISKYRDVCSIYGKPGLSFISWSIKEGTDVVTSNSTAGLLRFVTDTDVDNAMFEVQLQILRTKAQADLQGMDRLSSFSRLNLYGDSSWCIGFETDEDKTMKELCHCKERSKIIV